MARDTVDSRPALLGARYLFAGAGAALLWGPAAAGLTATGLPIAIAGGVAGVLLAAGVWFGGRALPASWDTPSRVSLAWLAAIVVSFLIVSRLSVFMYDPSRTSWSVMPGSELYVPHSCFTSMTVALGRLDADGNLYDATGGLPRVAGRFDPDPYFYAPQFLLLPSAISEVLRSQDFLALRSAWFTFQTFTLMLALSVLAVTVGGVAGRGIFLAMPLVWLAPPVLMNLQTGNFQVSAVALALAGTAWLTGGPLIAGGALLALAVTSKLFPGVLLVYLTAAQRYRAVAWTALWGLSMVVVFAGFYGIQPIRDYLAALPAIQDGTVGLTAMLTENPTDSVHNHSYYGLTRKLVALGLPIPAGVEFLVQTVAGLFVLAAAAIAARRGRSGLPISRADEVIVWVALLNLASFRSPFLPDSYAYVGVYILLALLAARLPAVTARAALVFGAAWVLMAPVDGLATLAFLPGPTALILTLGVQVAVIAVNLACALDRRFPDRVQRWLVGPSTV